MQQDIQQEQLEALLKGHQDAPSDMAAFLIRKINESNGVYNTKKAEAEHLKQLFNECAKTIVKLEGAMDSYLDDLKEELSKYEEEPSRIARLDKTP